MYVLCFYYNVQVVNYVVCGSTEEICTSCSKLITFISLTGREECVKTTVFGVTSHCPDAAMLVISATNGVGKINYVCCYNHTFTLCVF